MKYDMKSLDNAIAMLLPEIKKAIDIGVDIPRTSSLRMISEDYFIDSYLEKDQGSFNRRVAIYICQEAMFDMKEYGQFNFGDMSFEFK